MALNKAQLSVVNDKSKKLLVSAAAGSGKTFVLVEKLLKLIIEDKIDIDKIIMLSFTRAASMEMKARIRAKLLQEAIQNPSLYDQVDKMASAVISTMHSFCSKFVRRHFYLLDINPDFRLESPENVYLIKEQALSMALRECLASCMQERSEAMQKLTSLYEYHELRNIANAIYDVIISYPNPLDWFKNSIENNNSLSLIEQNFSNFIDKKLNSIRLAYSNFLEYLKQKYNCYNSNIDSFIEDDIYVALAKSKGEKLKYKLISSLGIASLKNKEFKEQYAGLIEEFKEARNSLKKQLDSLANYYYLMERAKLHKENISICLLGIYQIVEKFDNTYKAIKKRKNILEFNDVEHLIYKLLQNEDIAVELKENYSYIFVDECQDNSILQNKIIEKISECNINCFMVGDIKQSIYKFRNANPESFSHKLNSYSTKEDSEERKILLNTNYRSSQSVIDFSNQQFEKLFESSIAGFNYNHHEDKLFQGKEGFSGKQNQLSILEYLPSEALEKPYEIELNYAVNQILSLMANNADLSFNDFAILYPQGKEYIDAAKDIFERQGLPVKLTESANASTDSEEIDILLAYLKLLENPIDDVSLLCVLQSPIVNLNYNQISTIRLMGLSKEASFAECFYNCADIYDQFSNINVLGDKFELKHKAYAARAEVDFDELNSFDHIYTFEQMREDTTPSQDIQTKLKEIGYDDYQQSLLKLCSNLRRLLSQERFLISAQNIDDYLWSVIERSQLYRYFQMQENASNYINNMKLVCMYARDYIDINKGNISGFVDEYYILLRENKISQSKYAELMQPDRAGISFMTIHKSKGLQFKYVFLIGLDKNLIAKPSSLNISYNYGIGLKYRSDKQTYIDQYQNTDTMPFFEEDSLYNSFISDHNIQLERQEALRKLYVALTRAEEMLYMIVAKDVKEQNDTVDIVNPVLNNLKFGNFYAINSAKTYFQLIATTLLIDYPNIFDNIKIQDNKDDIFLKQFTPYCNGMQACNISLIRLNAQDYISKEEYEIAYEAQDLSTLLDFLEKRKSNNKIETIELNLSYDHSMLRYIQRPLKERMSVSILKHFIQKYGSLKDVINLAFDKREDREIIEYRPKLISTLEKEPKFMRPIVDLKPEEVGTLNHFVMQRIDLDVIRDILGIEKRYFSSASFSQLVEYSKTYETQEAKNISKEQILFEQNQLKQNKESKSSCIKELKNYIISLLNDMVNGLLLNKEHIKHVDINAIISFFINPIGIELLNSVAVYREKKFVHYIDGLIIPYLQGTIDCCYLYKGQLKIIDYKTDKTDNEEEIRLAHKVQLDLYKTACQETTNLNVEACYVYSFSMHKMLEI